MVDIKGDLQDGMLAYYLEQAKASDVNVEARLEREPFDFRCVSEAWCPVDGKFYKVVDQAAVDALMRKIGRDR
jgi:hypothetical protein